MTHNLRRILKWWWRRLLTVLLVSAIACFPDSAWFSRFVLRCLRAFSRLKANTTIYFFGCPALTGSAAVKNSPALDTIDHPVNFNEVIISPSIRASTIDASRRRGEDNRPRFSRSKFIIYSEKPIAHNGPEMRKGFCGFMEIERNHQPGEWWWKWMIIVCIIW